MAATEKTIQENMQKMEETPEQIIPSLGYLAYKAMDGAPGKMPGFFKEFPHTCRDAIERYASEDLRRCAGFGMRAKAQTIIRAYPKSLLRPGKLTDIAKETYEDITAFEYAVLVKDSYFVRKVVDFLKTYKGEDKREIVANLLEQFDRYFSTKRLAAVNRFIEANNAWRAAFSNLAWNERDRSLVKDVGGAQAKFPAHILQEYCHPTRSFDPTPNFREAELPEAMNFYNWNNEKTSSLLVSYPGVLGNFALIRCWWVAEPSGVGVTGVEGRWRPRRRSLEIDCAAVDALDKARTADLLVQRERLTLLLKAEDSLAQCRSKIENFSQSAVSASHG